MVVEGGRGYNASDVGSGDGGGNTGAVGSGGGDNNGLLKKSDEFIIHIFQDVSLLRK